ncbi:FkbM family methyltransferase [Pseudomonas sp. SCB32]|uniref:FkbM family methyltransferase n=1 Tax=Pseudomonas sp. SCB32 TaxID=2653853 RepID=UPI0012657C39|nr:FkbM family methyltransferase [Pseudomonas sp. SCB32]
MHLDELKNAVLHRWNLQQIHDVDFNGLPLLQRSPRTILDIGANLGQSIVSLRVLFPDAVIHSFEANPLLLPSLTEVSQALPGTNSVHGFGLSNIEGTFELNVPYSGETPYLEESSIKIDYYELPWVKEKFEERGGLSKLEKIECRIRKGDLLQLSPDIIKVDVEGAEALVLEGLRETIHKYHPTILVENSDWANVTQLLNSLGYLPRKYDPTTASIVPMDGPTTNTFYIHETSLA